MSEKFDNESVEVEVDSKGGCVVELNVLVKPATCEEAHKQAVKAIKSRVSLPGFRKGKAPDAMIKKSYAAAIEQEWKDAVVNSGLREGLALTGIYPWSGEGVPHPKVESTSLEEGSRMTFSFEREPEIPEIKGSDLKLKKEAPREIGDAEISEEIEGLRKRHATFEEVDGKVEMDGFCRITVESLEGEEPEEMVTDHRVEVKEGDLADWLIALIKGKKAGEEAEGKTEAPKNTPEDASKDASGDAPKEGFKSVPVRVKIVAVEKQVLPEDEDFLESLKLDSMDDLKGKTRERLEADETRRVETDLRDKLWQQLREKFPFELPASLFAAEKKATVQRMIQERRQQGQSKEEILAQEKEIEAAADMEVAQRLQTIFMARKITAEAGNQPDEKDVQQRVSELLLWESLSQGRMPDQKNLDPQVAATYRNQAFLMLVQEKAEEHLLSEAKLDG